MLQTTISTNIQANTCTIFASKKEGGEVEKKKKKE
jgi:hypothetical protein